MRFITLCFLSALLCAGCNSSKSEPTAPPKAGAPEDVAATPEDSAGDPGDTAPAAGEPVRTAAVSTDSALYERVEGTSANNACTSDADCKASGCSKEVCAAEEVMSACDVLEWPQGADAKCGCVSGACAWYR